MEWTGCQVLPVNALSPIWQTVMQVEKAVTGYPNRPSVYIVTG